MLHVPIAMTQKEAYVRDLTLGNDTVVTYNILMNHSIIQCLTYLGGLGIFVKPVDI